MDITEFQIINTPNSNKEGETLTGISFFVPDEDAPQIEDGHFYLNEGDMVAHRNNEPLFRFKGAASSAVLQSVDEVTLIGVKSDGAIIIDVDCTFARPSGA